MADGLARGTKSQDDQFGLGRRVESEPFLLELGDIDAALVLVRTTERERLYSVPQARAQSFGAFLEAWFRGATVP